MEVMTTAKAPQLKLVRIMNILKRNILSPIIMADKILSKTIKITISDCLVYIPDVTRLFFKSLLLLFIEPY